jgi:hypothetical protein
MNEPTAFDWPAGRRWQRPLLIAGLVAAALCGLAALIDVEQLLRSYLFAYVSWLGISVGSLGLWMLHNLTGGAWGLALRRIWEAATRTLPLLAGLFVPIALGAHVLFPWASAQGSELGAKADYLNVPFFLARAAFYFFIWIGMAFLLNRWSAAHDRTADPALVARARNLSGPGLVVCALTVTFAAVDWMMSLEPEWYSTIFGALVGTGHLLAALAFTIAVATWLVPLAPKPPSPARPEEQRDTWNDLGNLLLTFVMLWTYMAFSQFLLIWSGNLPEEITWYLHRTEGGWQWIGLSLAVAYFALPFCVLLSHGVKRDPDTLRVVAILIVVMSVVNDYWLIAPAFSPGRLHVHWTDPVAFVAIGGLWLAFFLRQLEARPIVPAHPQLIEEELRHA